METSLRDLLSRPTPLLTLAPMQDVTDHPFWKLMAGYGGADLYCAEYFRVTIDSRLTPKILKSITHNPTGRPVVAQMIGNDIPALVRTARELQRLPIVAVDLNLGCPVPVVYKKCAGGGLLRDPARVDRILGALRDAVTIAFTVKTRLGFDDAAAFDAFLPIFARHSLDLLAVHGRTVAGMYRSAVDYARIAQAVIAMPCPVLANGNVFCAEDATRVLEATGAAGLMIGRGAIRNPWLFDQIRATQRGEIPFAPTGHDLLAYIYALDEAVSSPEVPESAQVNKMKKYMNFVASGIEPSGDFLHAIRRVTTRADFFATCRRFLDHPRPVPFGTFHSATQAAS